jgi:hypothetical protein
MALNSVFEFATFSVMAVLDTAIHVLLHTGASYGRGWMPGSSPGMTVIGGL